MAIKGTARVACPSCKTEQDVPLVQSINARNDPDAYAQLLDGTLNLMTCACGKRTQLVARLVLHDPDRSYYAQVVPDRQIADAELAFQASGASGTLRIVPSQNALVEKLKILHAGLEDWAIEMTKVLLLASETDELDTIALLTPILLFDGVDRDAGLLQWIRYDDDGPRRVASALAAYEKLAAREASRPAPTERQIDRAWALTAARALVSSGN